MSYEKKNIFDTLFVSKEVQAKKDADIQRQHIKNTMCSRCENVSFCQGGIMGCGAFKMKEIFKRNM